MRELRGHSTQRAQSTTIARARPLGDATGLHEFLLDIRAQQAERAEHAGRARDHHAPDAERLGDLGRHHRPVAAEGDEREVARVAAAIGRDRLHGARHRGDRERQHAARRARQVEAQRARDLSCKRGAAGIGLERKAAAGQRRVVDVAERQEGVGQRRLRAAEPVADRARDRRRRSAGRP